MTAVRGASTTVLVQPVLFMLDGQQIGRTDSAPRPGEVISLESLRRWGGRAQFRVLRVERFYEDTGVATPPDVAVYEPGDVIVTLVRIAVD